MNKHKNLKRFIFGSTIRCVHIVRDFFIVFNKNNPTIFIIIFRTLKILDCEVNYGSTKNSQVIHLPTEKYLLRQKLKNLIYKL